MSYIPGEYFVVMIAPANLQPITDQINIRNLQ